MSDKEVHEIAQDEEQNKKIRVLIVDDSRIIRVALKRILVDDFEVDEAEDGIVALEKINSGHEYDLLISDLNMPNLNGIGLISRVRSHQSPKVKQMPILVISGDELADENKEALSEGAADYILKPFNSKDVLKSINALMRLIQQQKEQAKNEPGGREEDGQVDRLTGLGNLSHFYHRGEQELSFAKRHHNHLAVVLIHFDSFYVHQKHLGRKLALALFRQAGVFVKEYARTEDTVARIREDRFGMILSMSSVLEAKTMIDRIMQRVHGTQFKVGDRSISFTISAGASSPNVLKVDSFEDIVMDANAKLEKAIASGGDSIVIEDSDSKIDYSSIDNVMQINTRRLLKLIEEENASLESVLDDFMQKLKPLLKRAHQKHGIDLNALASED